MTAEIAIVNRSAVTLAADSAMTLSVGGRRKVYTSTDKIFQLSEKDPIGLMIYNNLDFLGAPLDVLIRHFRASKYCCRFESVDSAAEAFFSYLASEWQPSKEVNNKHIRQIIAPHYEEIIADFNKILFSAVNNNKDAKKIAPISLFDELIRLTTEKVEFLENYRVADCFEGLSEKDLLAMHGDVIDSVINTVFRSPPMNGKAGALFRHMGVLILHRDVYSELLTGFVFAGFGKQDIFPSLRAYHTDGIIGGKLKVSLTDEVTTSREQITAKIIPFAQREIVDRFLEGLDPDLEDGIHDYLLEFFQETKRHIFDGVGTISEKAKKTILENIEATLGVAIGNFGPDWLNKVKKSYSQETEDMVLFMAKQELAQLAEALVNLTSIKRKFSADEESVAGPIDVAVISRSDGFVWVKRKHYFPPELNQRYFNNKSGQNRALEGSKDDA